MTIRLRLTASLLAFVLPFSALAAGPQLELPKLTPAQVESFQDANSDAQEAVAKKDWAGATRAYQKAARIHPGNEGLWYNLACVQALQGKTDAAMASLQKAADAGWADDAWPAKDSDLTALRDDPRFQSWLVRVKEASANKPAVAAPGALASTAEEIEKESEAADERMQSVSGVLGSTERARANAAIARWKLASWDAIAESATDDAARSEAEWSALRSLVRKDLQVTSPDLADEVIARADRFAAEHPSSEHADEARYAGATARFSRTWSDEDRMAEGRKSYESDLLRIAAASTKGPGLERALAQLISLSDDDDAMLRGLHSRLRSIMGDDEKFTKLMLSEARGAHYRLTGLPAFEAKTLDGRTVTPADLRGKVTLIDFWATWCGPCRGELPHIKEAYSKFKDRGFEIVGVSLDIAKDGDPTAFQAWCAENGVTWPQIFDGKHWEAALAKKFGVQGIPFPLLIDRDGHVAFADEQLRGEDLLKHVESLLEPPVGL